MTHVVFAYLRGGAVYLDYDAWENGDRLGTYVTIFNHEGRQIETERIGGRKYRGMWIWPESETEEDGTSKDIKEYGYVPLISFEE